MDRQEQLNALQKQIDGLQKQLDLLNNICSEERAALQEAIEDHETSDRNKWFANAENHIELEEQIDKINRHLGINTPSIVRGE